jgi:hypothetical protein
MFQKCCGSKNRHAAKRVEGQQIGIAGDQEVTFAVDRDLKKLVVARVAAGADRLVGLDVDS